MTAAPKRRWYLRPSVALIAAVVWFGAAILSQGILKHVYGDLDDFPRVQLISLNLMVVLLLASVSSFLAAPVLCVLDRRNRHAITTAPKRRWFRYSLRTLFVVVTVLGCWLGYQANWIYQRKQFIAGQYSRLRQKVPEKADSLLVAAAYENSRGLLGDRVYGTVYVLADDIKLLTADELRQVELARSLFPEAQINFSWVSGDRAVHYQEIYHNFPANYRESTRH